MLGPALRDKHASREHVPNNGACHESTLRQRLIPTSFECRNGPSDIHHFKFPCCRKQTPRPACLSPTRAKHGIQAHTHTAPAMPPAAAINLARS
jgi:hypothetical protein